MRIQGRLLRPSTLAERRVMKSIGLDFVRVPRKHNPFAVARLLRRASLGSAEMLKVRAMLTRRPTAAPAEPTSIPVELPDSTSEARDAERAA